MTKPSPFKYFKAGPDIIRLAAMIHVRFPLSRRNVEDLLHERGVEISHETIRFWWHRSHEREGHDHFGFREVPRTRKPVLSQFDILLEQGEITMDHLTRWTSGGRVSEKRPHFKINAGALGLLFPPSKSYALR